MPAACGDAPHTPVVVPSASISSGSDPSVSGALAMKSWIGLGCSVGSAASA